VNQAEKIPDFFSFIELSPALIDPKLTKIGESIRQHWQSHFLRFPNLVQESPLHRLKAQQQVFGS